MNAFSPGGLQADDDSIDPLAGPALDLGAFGGIAVRLSVEVGAVRLPLRDVLALQPGSVHTLDRRVDQPVDVLINDRLIARGEIVAVGDRFGVKLTEIMPGTPG
ncbi:flagellar motor switch protein FliN [Polymorphobacter sp.]|uniref:flagellar motor switch protein FliN n=1 Tax=Polymorphobacter sp. TaxID=1909290 RepID=UPI003F709080